uniref:50S ribosomal protein L2 n=1 Tax=uncultured Microgenomates bacterium Rifle_16ft_4_minimus_5036 TaxID=1665119 RepID=A0A0H4T904_9BACT|nr:50S ribosomal protein L2, large subunit ribosomal protein L2 [uncultured Microgenomates bacterium Rifle_16ft_4_minimus_5036]
MTILPKNSGRGASGRITVRHQGGRKKRFLREIDFKRNKKDVWGKVEEIQYDPNRNSDIALVIYEDGERRYILAPVGLKEGAKVIASELAPLEVGNSLPLSKIPAGTAIHNIEIKPGKGGQIVRSAGSAAVIQGKEDEWVLIKMPSNSVHLVYLDPPFFSGSNYQVEKKNGKHKQIVKGIRPSVRGTAMHPNAHPHGGGEGRSGVGMKHPKTPYGKAAVGKTRKKNKYSSGIIVQPRKKGKHS